MPANGKSDTDSRRLLPFVSLRTTSSYFSCARLGVWCTAMISIRTSFDDRLEPRELRLVSHCRAGVQPRLLPRTLRRLHRRPRTSWRGLALWTENAAATADLDTAHRRAALVAGRALAAVRA